MKKVFALLLVLFCLLSHGCAFTPTLTPTPTPTPTPTLTSMSNALANTYRVSAGIPMHSVLRYSYENGIYFDGIIFSSATDYALHPIFGNVPEAEWIEPIEFSVSFDGNVSGDWSASLYKYENGSFSEVPASNLNDVDAEPGKYLFVISISVGRDAGGNHEYYNGYEMAWLNRSIQ